MRTLVEMRFGSHLYGTATPASDLDLKLVHVPRARDILLQRAKAVYSEQTKSTPHAKNTAEDVDRESYSLQKFLALVAEGQTVALDMLFAPAWALTGPADPVWDLIQSNRSRLLTRRYASFVGYCRTQANRYGIRGSRVAAARKALFFLTEVNASHGAQAKLGVVGGEVSAMAAETEHMEVLNIPSQAGTEVLHWEVCGRKMPFTSSIKSAQEIMQRVVDEYGHRALAAERNQGVDWKALSHAVRIARQAVELLETGEVIFPRPDAADLLEIKTGQRTYQSVADEIEALLVAVEAAAASSLLPDAPDHAWIEDLVAEIYAKEVCGAH